MKILVIGTWNGTSKYDFLTVKKIFNKTKFLSIDKILNKLEYALFYHLFPNFFDFTITRFYKKNIKENYDLILFNNVDLVNLESIKFLKKKTKKIIFFCKDNPFLNRDKFRWKLFKKTLPYYDNIFFMQKNREKYLNNVIKNYFTILPFFYKKIHKKNLNKKNYQKKDICFIGTWFPERGEFFYNLKKLGLDFDIYGDRWSKDKKYYKFLKTNIMGPLEYNQTAKFISSYKINLGLLSKGNDDDITNRCIEIPASGSLLCCENSITLKKIFKENKEAIFFNTPKECANKCKQILNNEKLLKKIALRGKVKVRNILNLEAEKVFKKILNFNFLNSCHKKFLTKF